MTQVIEVSEVIEDIEVIAAIADIARCQFCTSVPVELMKSKIYCMQYLQ